MAHNDIGALNRRQAMCHRDGRASLRSLVERLLDHLFRLGIESRSRLVEKKNWRGKGSQLELRRNERNDVLLGLRMRARAIAIRCFCPPLSWAPLPPTSVS